MTVLYSLAWVLLFRPFLLFLSFFFLIFSYHLRNPFTLDECSVVEITLHYGRAFDSPDACVLVSAWEFHYRCYWFGLSSFLWAVLHICHLTDDEYIAHLVVCILFHRKNRDIDGNSAARKKISLKTGFWNMFVCLFLLCLCTRTET